jgi:glutamine cyclotransferase
MLTLNAARAQQPNPTPTPRVELFVPQTPGYPHDPAAYTQGLLLHDGFLYESTGLYGESSLRRVDITTGEVLQRFDVTRANLAAVGWLERVEAACTLTSADDGYARGEIFAEGLALVGDRLIQLSWREECALVYDVETFALIDVIRYDDTPDQIDQGWGLCYDGERLIMSDGSAQLYFRDASTFERIGAVTVTYAGQPLPRLNELECVDGSVYANIYQQPYIVRIDAETGIVTGIISVTNMLTPEEQIGVDVLNGIAHIPGTDRFLITGKNWSRLFEVRFVPVTQQPF